MGRINLAALRVRTRALQKYNSSTGRGVNKGVIPNWADVVGDVPPAQILIRQQPHPQPLVQVRTRSLPESTKTQQYITIAPPTKSRARKASRLFAPVEIKYEEDELRRRFFSDHPWELARPRVVLETDGNQYKEADWSKGLIQPKIPVSGESVVQRQLWLLENTPDITVSEAYDIARREFYMIRRGEETRRRIAAEEAEHMGAVFPETVLEKSLKIENAMYNDWEKWSKDQTNELLQKSSAVGGEPLPVEEEMLLENEEEATEEKPIAGNAAALRKLMSPSSPFAAERQRTAQYA